MIDPEESLETPSAALQFAEALVNSINYASKGEALSAYWDEKLIILSQLHGVPFAYLGGLMRDFRGEAISKLYDGMETYLAKQAGEPCVAPRVSAAVKMALSAAAKDIDPFEGLLAYSSEGQEREVWRAGVRRVLMSVVDYQESCLEFLASLLALQFPTMKVAALHDSVLIANGLPAKEPKRQQSL
jgi:hypothetical protein